MLKKIDDLNPGKPDPQETKEQRYYRMIDEVQDYAIILLNTDGIIQNWNKGAQEIKQYLESEAVGKHFSMFYLPEDLANNLPQTLLSRAAEEGKARHEGWRLRKDKTRFWGSVTLTAIHNERGDVTGFSKVTRDLTDKKLADDKLKDYAEELRQMNEALRKSEDRYHKMIAEVQDYAIILLNENGNILNWNAGAEKIKGYNSNEIIGKNFSIFYLPEDQQTGLPNRLIQTAVTTGRANHEGWRVRKDGSTFWGSIVITALHNDDGDLIGFSKVTRDLTERKLTEDKMKAYMLELELQNRELEQFAYIASHDLQEPLRKIQTFTGIIERNGYKEEILKKYFDKINASAQRMSELINSVLNYSRLTKRVAEEKEQTDLRKILDDIMLDYELLIHEKNAVINISPLPHVQAVPVQINQLFANLLGNALKFNDKKSPVINIVGDIVSGIDNDTVPQSTNGKFLRLVISDNGIGFDQQYKEVIFTIFQRLHGKLEYSGTGIGLALCKKIMENHDGFISANGHPGKGANFIVYFPL